MAPFVDLYIALINDIEKIGVKTFSSSQDVPRELPVVRVQLLNGNSTNAYQNAREYSYSFQVDVVTAQNELTRGLKLANQVMEVMRKLKLDSFSVVVSEPSLSSMIDTSTNRVLNRQIIRANYTVIENTAF